MIEGKLYRGTTGSAGEIGHMTLFPEGVPCNCGNQGCTERYIGAIAMAAEAKRRVRERFSIERMVEETLRLYGRTAGTGV